MNTRVFCVVVVYGVWGFFVLFFGLVYLLTFNLSMSLWAHAGCPVRAALLLFALIPVASSLGSKLTTWVVYKTPPPRQSELRVVSTQDGEAWASHEYHLYWGQGHLVSNPAARVYQHPCSVFKPLSRCFCLVSWPFTLYLHSLEIRKCLEEKSHADSIPLVLFSLC